MLLGCAYIWNFSFECSTRHLNTRREIPHPKATLYYFVYCIYAVGIYWRDNSTNDLGLRMVNALPFINQQDRVTWSAKSKTRKKIIVNFHVCGDGFSQGWKSWKCNAVFIIKVFINSWTLVFKIRVPSLKMKCGFPTAGLPGSCH